MRKLAFPALTILAVATACTNSTPSYGDFNSIIAVMAPSVWDEVGDDVYDALEPTIKIVGTERTFAVTYQNPNDAEWHNLRRFRQLLLVGTADDPWIQEALPKVRGDVTGPGLYHAYDIWARDQQATVIVAEPDHEAEAVRADLQEINQALDQQFRSYARARMFLSGTDSALADTLSRTAGFRLVLPDVYRWQHQDSIYTFRNDNPDPAELIRQITVTWRSPIPASMTSDEVLAWRAEVAETYGEPQDVDLSQADTSSFEYQGRPAFQVQALWKNPPQLDWPAAGPFITRTVTCPQQDRLYLLDAWLYAPGKEKYEYMIQLQTILDSFRCGAS
jgi:hypothetical protein